MQFEESRSIRSFVGRIDPGDDIVEALTLLCSANDIGAAEVRVYGTLEDIDVVRFDSKSKEYRSVVEHQGTVDVVQFSGNMTRLGDQPVLRADALLAIDGPVGQQFVFGQLRRAIAVDCEFVVQAFADVELRRKLDPATGRFPIESIESTGAPAPAGAAGAPREAEVQPRPIERRREAPPTIAEPALARKPQTLADDSSSDASEADEAPASSMSWDDAVAESEKIKPARQRERRPIPTRAEREKDSEDVYGEYDFDEPILKPGDMLDHPKLGECRVIRVEDDDYAHIRLSRGQIRKLALEIVELEFQEERDGKNVFKVRVRK